MKTLISFGPFRAENMNLAPTDFVDGLPSPSAAMGFVGGIARTLGVSGWDHRALLVIHDLERGKGRLRGEQIVKSGRVLPIETKEGVTGRGMISVIAEIPGEHDLEEITTAFLKARIAGGTIFSPFGSSVAHSVRIIGERDMDKVLGRLPRGLALCPPQGREGTSVVSFGEETSLEAIAMRAYSAAGRQQGGMIVPCPVGYRVLEETLCETPPLRARRKDVPFALVDTAVGLAELVSIRNREVFASLEGAMKTCAWSWACAGNMKMFSQFHLDALGV